MTDRELLEAAAKAAGLRIDKSKFNGGGSNNTGFDLAGNAMLDWHNNVIWNPLTDDGDCARLEVALLIELSWSGNYGVAARQKRPVHYPADWKGERYDEHGGDKNKARRYASVRAAAAAVKDMEAK